MVETKMVCSKMSDILSSTLLDCLQVKTKINYMNQIRKYLPVFNPLKPELNPICYLLALLGAHHFLHVSRIRVKLLTLR